MTIEGRPGKLVAVEDGRVVASMSIYRLNKTMIATDLEGTGNPQAIAMGLTALKELSAIEPVLIGVDLSNPKADRLMKAYERFGARKVMMMMEVK